MDNYLKDKSNELLKSLYKAVKKFETKKDAIEDLFDANNVAETNPDEVSVGRTGTLNKKQGVPEEADPATHERCVKKVKAKGHDKGSAFAICNEAKAGQKEVKKSEEILQKLSKNLEIVSKAYDYKIKKKKKS